MTQVFFTGDGSTREYDVTFPFLSEADVKLSVNGVDQTITWISGSRIQLATAPESGAEVRLYRDTQIDEALVSFQDGAVLSAADLNLADTQLLYKQQELEDRDAEVREDILRTMRAPLGETLLPLPDAATRANKIVAFNSSGSLIALAAATGVPELALPTGAGFIRIADGASLQEAIAVATDVAGLVASTDPLVEGSMVRTADGFAFKVADASAVDHDLITAGGVKLYAPRDTTGVKVLTPQMFGMVADGGDASADTNAIGLTELRAAAEAAGNGCKVQFGPGVYTLPPLQDLAADHTEWIFAKGAILKLHSVQATDDFLYLSRPTGQIVRNIQFDANRAAQDEATFGADNAGLLVATPTDCLFDGVEVISSPGKGFAVVSEAGLTTSGTHVRNVTGGNCATQAVLIDANNGTGFFEDSSIDGVRVGTTDHAGLAINDGAENIDVRNVYCDVGPGSVWDAVSVRDSSHLQLTNVHGKGGRHGVHIFKSALGCTDIDLSNVKGEGSNGSGVLFTAVQRVRGNNIVGVNNAGAGVNLARITTGDERCEDIHLTNVTGIDTQGVPTQDYGIILGGTRRCTINGYTVSGNTVEDATLVTGVNEDSRIEWSKTFTAAVPSVPANGTATVNIPITAPFLIEYLQIRSLRMEIGTTSLALQVSHVSAFTATNIQVIVRNASGTTAWAGTLVAVVGSK